MRGMNAGETRSSYKYEKMSLFGRDMLFTISRIDRDSLPKGVYAYDIRHDDSGNVCSVAQRVLVNHYGTVLSKERIPEFETEVGIRRKNYNFTGDECTLDEFMSKTHKE